MAAIGRKDRQSLQELDNHVKEFRQQFSDQIKCLDSRLENKTALVTDVQEFIRKRSELELDYSKNMERLADRFTDRFHKQRSLYGLSHKERAAPVSLWSKMLKDTKYKARAAATMSDILLKNVATRFSDLHEDVCRICVKVKDIQAVLQEEIMKHIVELQQAMKMYYTRQSEYVFARAKLREAESAKIKAEKEGSNKKGNEKRMKNLDRIKEKRQLRYNDNLIKATRARNEYILVLEATKAALNKYYDHDISDIVSNSDHNFHNSFKCAFQAYCKSELNFANSVTSAADTLSRALGLVDPDNDRLNFLEDNQQVFCPERKVSFVKHSEDTITTISAVGALKKDLEKKQENLYAKLEQMKLELAELSDVMIGRNNELNNVYRMYDSEMNAQHSIDLIHPPVPMQSQPALHPVNPQIKIDKEEKERGFLNKFKELILSQNLNISKQAKYDALTIALGEKSQDQLKKQLSTRDEYGSPANIGLGKGKPIKLFGTTLEHQFKQTNRDIPELVESCIRFISRFGLEHQGIFRVSGTSQEISDMKKSFEEGKDPLAGLNHWKDINAVAGVFRAYFRELEEPLFLSKFCDDYIRISRLPSVEDQIQECKEIFSQFPSINLHIIKYLFKFLNLVSSKSDKNKMTSHNLAVVFGPTVIHAPATIELITNQGQINIFIEILISEFFSLFPDEKRMNDDDEGEDENEEGVDDDGDVSYVSDEENDEYFQEAEALYDYYARSHKELSFKKGDIIQVFTRANKDWWDARIDGALGFVPANYVKVASPENERLDVSSDDALCGATEVPSKAETSSEEPFLLEEKLLSPRSDDGHSHPETPRSTSSVGEQKETRGNFFDSIDPTVSKPANMSKSATIGPKSSTTPLSGPQPFQIKGGSLPRGALKSDSDTLMASDSLSTTVFAVREAFGGQRMLKPAAKAMAISADDLKVTQGKLRSGTPEDAPVQVEATFEERPIPIDRGGSVKNIKQMFSNQAVGSIHRKPFNSHGSDDGLTSPLGDENRRLGGASMDERDRDREGRPPAPAVKPKPVIRRESSGVTTGGQAGTGQSELIASIKAAAVAKVVKDVTGGVKEETNL